MAINQDLKDRIAAIKNSASVRVVPVGEVEDANRGILKAANGNSHLGNAVRAAFGAVVIAAALSMGGISDAKAQGVGYDANVYGQAQGQVMQQGSAVRMQVLDVRNVQIEVAPQQRSTGSQVADYAVTGAGGAVGAILGGQVGKTSQAKQVGAILGGLVGAVAGNLATDAVRSRGSGPQVVDGVELTMVNPANNQLSTITQAGTTQFQPGDRVMVVQMGNSHRVVPDRSQTQAQDQGYGQGQGFQKMSYGQPQPALNPAVNAVISTARTLGIQVDAAAVADLYQTGRGKDGWHVGRVVGVDQEHGLVYQSTGRGQGVVHSMQSLNHVPQVGDMVTVKMNNGRGTVESGQGQGRGGNGRI